MNEVYDEIWRRGKPDAFNIDDYLALGEVGHARLLNLRKERFGAFSREDIAYAIQHRTEEQVCDFIAAWKNKQPDLRNIALAGGIFGNVKLNQRIKALGFERIFIQPAMSDAGLCLGAALLAAAHKNGGRLQPFRLKDVFLGVEFSDEEIKAAIDRHGLSARYYGEDEIAAAIAQLVADKKVVAHFYGKMEFGPRALGNRSILYSAADPAVNDWLNKQLKRTEFMPFAPAVMYECASDYFLDVEGAEHAAEFMTITFDCTEKAKAEIPAAVHVDGTARPQLVHRDRNPRFYNIIRAYRALTNVASLINTSFNMHEEPIVATPDDAIRAYQIGHLDALILGNRVIEANR